MLAHAEAVKVIRQHAKKTPKVGVAFSSGAWVPEHETPGEIEDARKKTVETGGRVGKFNKRYNRG